MAQEFPKISVIVPVYNMEKTLPRCLDSIQGQNYTNFEVILINDGSKDGTANICKYYSEKYDNIIYVSRENKGLSYTLKEGVCLSSAPFVIFVDSDDYVEPMMMRTLVTAQGRVNADIVQSGINFIRPDGSMKGQKKMANRMIDNKKALFYAYFIDTTMNKTLAAALFRRSLFDDVFFPEKALSIDLQIMPYVLNNCKVYQQIDVQLYNAVQYPNSVSRGDFSESMYRDKMNCNLLLDFFFEEKAPWLKDYMYYRKSEIAASMYYKIYKTTQEVVYKDEKMKELKQLFADNYNSFKESSCYSGFGWKKRMGLRLFNIHPCLYVGFMTAYSKFMNIHI